MSFAVGVTRGVRVEGALPHGWRETSAFGGSGESLRLDGPTWVGERRPKLVVRTESAEGGAATGAGAGAGVEPRVEGAARDRWPHPRWGTGVVHQGVRVDGDVALAHDVYLFHDGRTAIRVELECELQSLFAVEEDVASILDALSSGGAR